MTSPPALHLEGSARIDGRPVFGPLRLHVPAGRWTCLLGPSGVGKSTILRLIAGLDDDIELDGRLTTDDGLPLGGRIALMAQSDLLMPWLDVSGNVAIGASLRGETVDAGRVAEVLTRVGLTDHADRKPNALSGGQRQRVALARTLLEDRPVVLLDEPFSALDARTRAMMQDLAVEVLAERTVLHVTHDTAEAGRMGDRVLLMSRGGLDEIETPVAPTPRRFDAPETMAFQARLLRLLLELQ